MDARKIRSGRAYRVRRDQLRAATCHDPSLSADNFGGQNNANMTAYTFAALCLTYDMQ